MSSPQQKLQEYLVNEIGLEASKRMVKEWKELGCDLSNGNNIKIVSEQPELVTTMAMLSNLGFLEKILYVQKQFNKQD